MDWHLEYSQQYLKDEIFPINVAYAHLQDLILKVDQKISQGEIIGHVGSTGSVDTSQLHLLLKRETVPLIQQNISQDSNR